MAQRFDMKGVRRLPCDGTTRFSGPGSVWSEKTGRGRLWVRPLVEMDLGGGGISSPGSQRGDARGVRGGVLGCLLGVWGACAVCPAVRRHLAILSFFCLFPQLLMRIAVFAISGGPSLRLDDVVDAVWNRWQILIQARQQAPVQSKATVT